MKVSSWLHHRQAKVLTQRRVFILGRIQAPTTQFRHDQLNEQIQLLRHDGGHDVEAVRAALLKPKLEVVGNIVGGTDDDAWKRGKPAIRQRRGLYYCGKPFRPSFSSSVAAKALKIICLAPLAMTISSLVKSRLFSRRSLA